MLSFPTRHGPDTGSLNTPVKTVRPCHGTSLGIPTFTDTNVPTGWPDPACRGLEPMLTRASNFSFHIVHAVSRKHCGAPTQWTPRADAASPEPGDPTTNTPAPRPERAGRPAEPCCALVPPRPAKRRRGRRPVSESTTSRIWSQLAARTVRYSSDVIGRRLVLGTSGGRRHVNAPSGSAGDARGRDVAI